MAVLVMGEYDAFLPFLVPLLFFLSIPSYAAEAWLML
jgi:hypothetical protein